MAPGGRNKFSSFVPVIMASVDYYVPRAGVVETAGTGAVERIFALVNILTGLIGAFAFLSLIAAGYLYIASCGDERKVEAAKRLTGAAIAALVMVVLARAVTEFLLQALQGIAFPGISR